MALRFSKYWRNQKKSPSRVLLDDPLDLMDRIDMGEMWEPAMLAGLSTALKLGVIGRFGRNLTTPDLDDDTKTVTTQASTRSGISGLTIGGLSKSTAGDEKGVDNDNYHQVLFGEIKDRKKAGRTVKSRDVRDMIKKGDLPALPPSKADGLPMCLAWHTKGICNPSCPRAPDHDVIYTVEEYAPLCSWCETNYPKDE